MDRTFEAVAFGWEGTAVADWQVDAARIRRRVEALCCAGVHLAVMSGADVERLDGQLAARPKGPGRLYLCALDGAEMYTVGPRGPTLRRRRRVNRTDAARLDDATRGAATLPDQADGLRWFLATVARDGIGPGLVLVVGSEFGNRGGVAGTDAGLLIPELARAVVVSVAEGPEGVPAGVCRLGGGPRALARLVDAQLARRSGLRVPSVDEDPAWTVEAVVEGPGELTRARESLQCLANGHFGVRGAPEENGPGTKPMVLAAGVYEADPDGTCRLLEAPRWTDLDVRPRPYPNRQVLDLRTGVLLRERRGARGRLRTLRFVSAVRSGAMALRAEGSPAELAPQPAPTPPPEVEGAEAGDGWARTRSRLGGGVVAAAATHTAAPGGLRSLERLAAYVASPATVPSPASARRRLEQLEATGFERLLAEHRRSWARRWEHADVVITGDPELQVAVRFALFHLMTSVADQGEAAVAARGLSGPAYLGHVFWDADVFVLPFLAATHPPAARAMLEYRWRRLPAARRAAEAAGRRGARFPWESAHDGSDVTPGFARDHQGAIVPILTGSQEDHITADVAWAADHYWQWTGDDEFLSRAGADLILDTARYSVSRAEVDPDGRAHIRGVIGPDEYHERVDDNAYTNVMARWNLRRAAHLARAHPGVGVPPGEADAWCSLADALVDGYQPSTGRYEQFAGYFDLEPLLITEVATPPVAADVLLGPARVAASQVIKQADVLMLHHLVPNEVAPGSLRPNLDFYLPRTAHGSSLSPAVHAALLARAGQPDAALDLFRLACRLDLDDLTGTTADGLHLATMGGVWQALASGFAGLRPAADALLIDPHLPQAWEGLKIRLRWRGQPLAVCLRHDEITIRTTRAMRIRPPDGKAVSIEPPGATFAYSRKEVQT